MFIIYWAFLYRFVSDFVLPAPLFPTVFIVILEIFLSHGNCISVIIKLSYFGYSYITVVFLKLHHYIFVLILLLMKSENSF